MHSALYTCKHSSTLPIDDDSTAPCLLTVASFHRLCALTLVHRIQIIGHSYIAQMEWPRVVPREICIYVLYVCYNSENKQQQQQWHWTILCVWFIFPSVFCRCTTHDWLSNTVLHCDHRWCTHLCFVTRTELAAPIIVLLSLYRTVVMQHCQPQCNGWCLPFGICWDATGRHVKPWHL